MFNYIICLSVLILYYICNSKLQSKRRNQAKLTMKLNIKLLSKRHNHTKLTLNNGTEHEATIQMTQFGISPLRSNYFGIVRTFG
jgi:hypothetical protein